MKVHQVWAAKAGGLKKDSLLTVRLGAWGHPAFPSCGRLKEDSRYIFFMEPEANSSGRAPAAFRASFPPLETGRNLKKEVSRVLCKRCGKFLGPRGALGPGGEGGDPLEKGKATHSSILAWRIPWTVPRGEHRGSRHRFL